MVIATLELREPAKELGRWEFVALKKEGDYLGVRIDNETAALRVDAIVHSPVKWPAVSSKRLKFRL